ncbi:Outer membrane scaffolding protein for murein synthesis, MipA/OmpV family [Jannaschia faecimaris]|uniref:Outer membrane scaffolding protein for murein synthesis, MipA/OmpV family n=1 Tax=Jannaschia faecimaris TaxID=1244108 RepID=A0A1H3N3Z3_9RHOB|nr:MipA/OmpV family protein [Jannaschia faecimaris]SDY83185.1 Outer membrane scaffolding protein for murein synthesis, MipA/OmpV family [Jannaschia faecimaris]
MFRLTLAAVALTASSAAATAQDLGATVFSSQGQGPALGFTLRGGVATAPEYFGSDEQEIGPALGAELNYLRLGGFTFGNPDPLYQRRGLSFGGSFRYIGSRDDADSPELAGLNDVDTSVELGGGLRYSTENFSTFGDIRYGVIGHESFVAEAGADVILRPTDRFSLRAGPRVLFGDSDYASTYFGVTAAEAGASGFTRFDASGGLLSAGVEFGAAYRINDNWGIDATINYDKLQNDAADSPITRDDEQVSASIGFTRRFTLGF